MSPEPPRTEVIILAAGAGRRLGGRAKCLLEVEGHSLLERLVRAVCRTLPKAPFLVLGHYAAEIQEHLVEWPSHLIPRQLVNRSPEGGTASSMHIGLRAMDVDVQAIMVLLADQPLIDAADLSAVLDTFNDRPHQYKALVPLVNGVPGHPVMFDSTVRADLLAAPGTSLQQWRSTHPNATIQWVVDNDHYTKDLDTPDDLVAFGRETGLAINWPKSARMHG